MYLLQPNGWLVLQTLNYSNPSIKPGFKFPIVISELDHTLTDAGFSGIHHYADWNYDKFDLETSMCAITIARKHS